MLNKSLTFFISTQNAELLLQMKERIVGFNKRQNKAMIPMKGLTMQGLDLSQNTQEDFNDTQSEGLPNHGCLDHVLINQATCALPAV